MLQCALLGSHTFVLFSLINLFSDTSGSTKSRKDHEKQENKETQTNKMNNNKDDNTMNTTGTSASDTTTSTPASSSSTTASSSSPPTVVSLKDIDKQSMPVYLTKQQRALLAKQERQRLLEQKRLEAEKLRIERQKLLDQQQQQQKQQQTSSSSSSSKNYRENNSETVLRPEELRDLQQDYLGTRVTRTRQVKSSEKHKFSFDWKLEDDTSRDLNPIYDQKHESLVLFGRGRRAAGTDDSERLRHKRTYEQMMMERLKRDHLQMMKSQIEALSSSSPSSSSHNNHRGSSGSGSDERRVMMKKQRRLDSLLSSESKHWSEKTLAEMDSRDWRIFREDFEIGVKSGTGGKVPNPLRNWDESDLPFELVDRLKELGFPDVDED